jgi:hypothetical protein
MIAQLGEGRSTHVHVIRRSSFAHFFFRSALTSSTTFPSSTSAVTAQNVLRHRALVRPGPRSERGGTVLTTAHRRALVVSPGDPIEFTPPNDIRITNVALGDELTDASGRTSLKMTFPTVTQPDSDDEDGDDEPQIVETVLCSLTPGKVPMMTAQSGTR